MLKIDDKAVIEGPILPVFFRLFIPITLGALLQQCYNTIDVAILGNALGKVALAAAGGTSSTLIALLTGFFTGFASGASVVIAQLYGARHFTKLEDGIRTAMFLSILAGACFMLIGFFGVNVGLKLVNAPVEVIPLARIYLRTYFTGMIPMSIYNMGAAVLRAMGDTKRPVYLLAICCIINLILDILFVVVLKIGIFGAALATVLAQTVSAICILIILLRTKQLPRLVIKAKVDMQMMLRMLYIGVPVGLESIMYSISNMIIQSKINLFGTDTIAADTIFEKLDGFYWMFFSGFGAGIVTFMGQNYGAKRFDRIKKGLHQIMITGVVLSFMISLISMLAALPYYRLFTNDPQVLSIGLKMMYLLMPWYFLYIFIEVFSATIKCSGNSIGPLILCAIGICGTRLIWVNLMVYFQMNIYYVLFAWPFSWLVTVPAFVIYHFKYRHHYYPAS